ncbi:MULTISPECIES: DUF3253 domain-containing protein [Brevundimonas]|uniref:DUF3253 domain-containing protein n=1 Tax=Brevundimonas TaxID=41275 RepID=UPI000F03DD62|nr:DUF3253 domain-containing protein [Brevundimonas lutea]
MTDPIEASIFEKLSQRDAGKSICPSEVAKALEPERWQRMMPRVRAIAVGLAREGRLVITKKGKPVDPNAFKGVIRLKLPEAGSPSEPE